MKKIKFASYHTGGCYREEIEKHLLPTLKKFNLDYDIEEVVNKGDWYKNTAMKATVIKKMLLKYKQPIVFLDADSSIEKYPDLFFNIPSNIDIAYNLFNWMGFWRGKWEDKSNMQLLSGTLYFDYNKKVLEIIDTWIESNKNDIHIWEQKKLENIVNSRNDLNTYHLPIEYCTIIKPDLSIPEFIKEPVILHHQASRLYKNKRIN